MSDKTASSRASRVSLGKGKGGGFNTKILAGFFPDLDPGVKVFGDRVLVQLSAPREKSEGGIIIPEETQELEKWRHQLARVTSMGPVAYRDRKTMEPWPEGQWIEVGDFVRIPQFGGDKWEVTKDGQKALFCIYQDTDVIGKIIGDPLEHIGLY